ncbi:bifunctional 4-hydroxy-2-oxoglutarate aldolase/2-dehydro-3-deoxy-phosphogluconate aldolase [Natronincola ferrireducens]|uniref:2-dehydro-3-deoxyphosphogluconate aldolase / (4S)-4-hydroxy-2-oxoglutarate aldolase n=1 Tax=Natronincola ferrireducens TaxID=393762 RepID=A0A1G8YWA4_9FIRM|nr:bifunctional 4-hydroxy-2-oxoglutarate aldolase/2-dehydro-3-deoxy-phosphogluconate aldolase [Natronincola ferrireducens]SDK06345.1 2-dehydro-3-deoxyphosphogluconate aldolase / (4S)-4-hydroxy-2-oxoglutarate aldolase [Natronincola ferrireducens]
MNKLNKLKNIEKIGVVAILRKIQEEKVLDVVEAIYEGGVNAIEVTFNTVGAERMITNIKKSFGDKLLVGAGTIINEEQANIAIEAGAEFILSPSLHYDVIKVATKNDIIAIPGVYTPTEMVLAHQWGADIVKLFPAGSAGTDYMKLVKAPLDDIPIMAVGGIDLSNTADFIKAGAIGVGIGSALTPQKYIIYEEYDKISELGQAFVEEVKKGRA